MKRLTIEGVKCSLDKKGKLVLEIPQGFDEFRLRDWLDAHRLEAKTKLNFK